MELYEVHFEYKNFDAHKRWEKSLSNLRSADDDAPSAPPPLCGMRRVAVFGGYGSDPIKQAAHLTLTSAIGPEDQLEKYQAWVSSVTYVGSCAVQSAEV